MANQQTQRNIPDGWHQVRIKDAAFVNKKNLGGETPPDFSFAYIDLSSVDSGKVTLPSIKIQFKHAPSRAKRVMRRGNVLMSMVRPNLKGHCLIDFDCKEFICSTGFAVIENKKDVLNSYFLYSYLFSKDLDNQIKNLLVGSNYPAINSSDVENLKIVLPPLPEQNRIVSVLETWDQAIEKLTQKVEKKNELKHGLMQGLLTGKIRLSGFQNKWTEKKLGELFKERSERGVANLPLLSITSDRGVIYQSESNKKDTSNSDKSKYLRICPGDIGYNTMRMWQGRSALSKMEGLVSPAYTILSPNKEVDPRYFAYLFKTPRMINFFFQKSQGLVSDTWQCRYKDFAIIRCLVPDYKEQMAIANVLETVDREIKILEEKLNTIQEQKRYLLNNLITGSIRTPETL